MFEPYTSRVYLKRNTNEWTSLPESGRRLLDHQSAAEQGRVYACMHVCCVCVSAKAFFTEKFRKANLLCEEWIWNGWLDWIFLAVKELLVRL